MNEWCMQHPYMTFIVVLFCASTINSTLVSTFGKRKEPKSKLLEVDNDQLTWDVKSRRNTPEDSGSN